MTIEIYPTKFEAYDADFKTAVFSIEALDECCATIKIDAAVCDKSWPEISNRVMECLVALRLGEDDANKA